MHQLLESQNTLPLWFMSVVPPVFPLKYDSFTMHKIPTGIVSLFPQHLFMDVYFWVLWMHSGHTNGADNCCGNFTPEPPLLCYISAERRSATTSSSPEGGRRRHARGIHVPAECVEDKVCSQECRLSTKVCNGGVASKISKGGNVKSANSKTWR